jgi:hypothetical protein
MSVFTTEGIYFKDSLAFFAVVLIRTLPRVSQHLSYLFLVFYFSVQHLLAMYLHSLLKGERAEPKKMLSTQNFKVTCKLLPLFTITVSTRTRQCTATRQS